MVRRRWVSGMVVAAVGLGGAGCGGGDGGRSAPPGAQYLDPRSDASLAVSLDYDGEDWTAIKRLYARVARLPAVRESVGTVPPTLDGGLNLLAQFAGLSFTDDIRPLLGGTAIVASRTTPKPTVPAASVALLESLDEQSGDSPDGIYRDRRGRPLDRDAVERALALRDEPATSQTTFVYRVPDSEALDRVVGKLRDQGLKPSPLKGVPDAQELGGGVAIVGGDTLVAVLEVNGEGSEETALAERIRAGLADGAKGPPMPADADGALLAARVAPAALGQLMDAATLRRVRTDSDAGRALRGAEARLDLEEGEATARGRIDFEGLADDALPLGPAKELELPSQEGLGSASADQQRTTTFIARIARQVLPDSRFVGRVEALERKEGLRFEDEVLRAFAGPSVTALRPTADGGTAFAARSSLRDPARMRKLLPRIAPELPGILEGLQGLGSTGLAALLFVAPDAPLTPGAFNLLAAVDVRPVSPKGAADAVLYEVRGLDAGDRFAGPDGLVYGVIGDVFVVGSTRALAEEAARLPTNGGVKAATATRLDVDRLLARSPFGDAQDGAILRAILREATVMGSAEDGDVVASARVRLGG